MLIVTTVAVTELVTICKFFVTIVRFTQLHVTVSFAYFIIGKIDFKNVKRCITIAQSI